MDLKILAIVVPCYNEQEVLPTSSKKLLEKLNSLIAKNIIANQSYLLFVDDGSKDATWEIIKTLSAQSPNIKGAKLSSNKGHQFALLAGLMEAKTEADFSISIDSDLQDDIDVMDEMVNKYLQDNCEVVYAVRNKRATDTFFKKFTAETFYKLMLKLGVNIVYNHADYRLAGKKALEGLSSYEESNLFLRGIFPNMGFKSDVVTYERHERFAGESKYPLKKMLSFALDGITSFSTSPLRIVFSLGVISFLFSFALALWALFSEFFGSVIPGWSSTIISIYLLGSIQLISLGVIGEYIGKIYKEVKRRPRYIIDERTDPVNN